MDQPPSPLFRRSPHGARTYVLATLTFRYNGISRNVFDTIILTVREHRNGQIIGTREVEYVAGGYGVLRLMREDAQSAWMYAMLNRGVPFVCSQEIENMIREARLSPRLLSSNSVPTPLPGFSYV
ncbi:hypothetical protein AURDEDRAFT_172515 [Auricularia subglabra TFB-10046 SS5]|nr:hypothetical protein AURDEDRAFT_172515 [Auricularia subglabra TFB-10046 SS5]